MNLPSEQKIAIVDRLYEEKDKKRMERLWKFYGGDPDEVVWRGWTRYDLMSRFKTEENKYYSVQDVASELGITYDQAYKYIVPWLKAQGIRCD